MSDATVVSDRLLQLERIIGGREGVTAVHSPTTGQSGPVTCSDCQRSFADGETLYRHRLDVMTPFGFTSTHFKIRCESCENGQPRYRPPARPCPFCQRPVVDIGGRYRARPFCDETCQYRYYNRERARARAEQREKTCTVCDEETPQEVISSVFSRGTQPYAFLARARGRYGSQA